MFRLAFLFLVLPVGAPAVSARKAISYPNQALAAAGVQALLEGAVRRGATIRGRVSLQGETPKATPIQVTKDHEHCGDGHQVQDESLLISTGGAVENAVVYLEGAAVPPSWNPPRVELGMKKCVFVPHVLVAPRGSSLVLFSEDAVFHTIHPYVGRRTYFNIGFPKSARVVRQLDRVKAGDVMKFLCDEHAWMTAYLVVVDSPFFAVTDAGGGFLLRDVPPGPYRLRVWHETLGELSQPVTVKTKRPLKVTLTFVRR